VRLRQHQLQQSRRPCGPAGVLGGLQSQGGQQSGEGAGRSGVEGRAKRREAVELLEPVAEASGDPKSRRQRKAREASKKGTRARAPRLEQGRARAVRWKLMLPSSKREPRQKPEAMGAQGARPGALQARSLGTPVAHRDPREGQLGPQRQGAWGLQTRLPRGALIRLL